MGPSDIALLCVLVVLLLFSAFFSSAETALTTVNKIRLRTLVEEENKKAIVLNNVLNNSRKMLSTVLIGNNIVNIAASSIATIFTQSIFSDIFISVGVGILTLLIIIFGEIVPKTVASMHADEMALKYAKPISILMFVLTPVIFILNMFSNIILKLFRVKVNLNSKSITEDELRTIVGVSQEEGIIEDDEYDMITNVFDFGDACAKDIMIPKVDITMVPIDTTFEQLLDVIKTDKYTRIPVYKEDTDNIVGIINIKDMIINQVDASNFDIKKLMREPYYTHEKEELNDLLIEMRNNEPGMCIVLDEYGQAEGLITLEDIVDFHLRFERIHPFGDGNGRVGRAIMFKECLKNNIVPFIILDRDKPYYLRGLKEYDRDRTYLFETCLNEQDIYTDLCKQLLNLDFNITVDNEQDEDMEL